MFVLPALALLVGLAVGLAEAQLNQLVILWALPSALIGLDPCVKARQLRHDRRIQDRAYVRSVRVPRTCRDVHPECRALANLGARSRTMLEPDEVLAAAVCKRGRLGLALRGRADVQSVEVDASSLLGQQAGNSK